MISALAPSAILTSETIWPQFSSGTMTFLAIPATRISSLSGKGQRVMGLKWPTLIPFARASRTARTADRATQP